MPGDVFVLCCVKIVRILPCLLQSVMPVVHQRECLYGYRNDQWGDSCFQGEMQTSAPEIDTGKSDTICLSGISGTSRCFPIVEFATSFNGADYTRFSRQVGL